MSKVPSDVSDRVGAARFALARHGTPAHLVDLLIVITASSLEHALLTRDRDFARIARIVPLDLVVY